MKRCLIVVDYQKDFVTGSLGFAKAEEIEGRIAEKIKEYRKEGYDILFTLDTHGEDYLKTNEGRNLPVIHCVEGTEGHELFGEVGKLKNETDRVFCKGAFGSEELYGYLKKSDYSYVELVGVVTNICVISNAVLAKTALPEAEIAVDASCVASNDEELNLAALKVMEGLQIKIRRVIA